MVYDYDYKDDHNDDNDDDFRWTAYTVMLGNNN